MCPHHFLYSQNRQRLPPIFRRLFWPFRRWSEEFNPFWAYSQFPLKLQKIYKDSPAEKKVLAQHLFIILQVDILPIASLSWQTQLICCRISRVLWSLYLRFGWLPSLLLQLSRSGGTAQVLWPLFFSIRHITPATLFQRGWIWHVKSIWPPRCWMVLSDFQWFSMMLKMFDCHQALEKWSCVCSILNSVGRCWIRVNRNKSN